MERAWPVQARSEVEDTQFCGAILDPSGDLERETLSARSRPDLLLRREGGLTVRFHELTHPQPSQEGSRLSSASCQFPSCILAGLLLPALAKPKTKAQGTRF